MYSWVARRVPDGMVTVRNISIEGQQNKTWSSQLQSCCWYQAHEFHIYVNK